MISTEIHNSLKNKSKRFVTLSFLLILTNCTNSNDPIFHDDNVNFGIYFLSDTTLTETDIRDKGIDDLVINSTPWISENNIEFYDFSSHCIYLKKDKSHFFENYEAGRFYSFNPPILSRPFVVISNEDRCYIGALHSAYLSVSPIGPYIDQIDIGYFPHDVLPISRAWQIEDKYNRSHPVIKETLQNEGVISYGISLELVSIKLLDRSTVEYSIKITNNDKDDLYIIDPYKTGTDLFNYFTSGPSLLNDEPRYFTAEFRNITKPEPYYSWKTDWYSLIKSKETIERTIILKGYPNIPKNSYKCSMKYLSPVNIPKKERYINGTRIWLGEIYSNILVQNL